MREAMEYRVVIWCDEAHRLFTSKDGLVEAAKPFLTDGRLRMILSTTNDEFREYMESNKAFVRRFERVNITEPGRATTQAILLRRADGMYPTLNITEEVCGLIVERQSDVADDETAWIEAQIEERQAALYAGEIPIEADVIDTILRTGSNQERMWGIPVTSPHPEKAMRFLNLMFSSPEIANLLSNGLEGVHYVETEPGVITHAPGTDPARPGYGSVFSRFGDQMQVKHWVPTTPDFYRELASFNEQAQDSLSLGYVFNGERVASEIAAVTAVVSLYLPPLECGMLEDVDGALAEFNEKLQSAGIDRIIAENQRQLDAWLAEKNAPPES